MDIESALALAGIALAALLSALGYFLKTRIEAKKSARKVLYYLLEIRFSIRNSLIDPREVYEEFSTHMEKELTKRGIAVDRPAIDSLIGPLILEHLANIADAVKVQINEKILTPYEAALSDFSEINPVLAYTLKGREQLQQVILHTANYATTLEAVLEPLFNKEKSDVDSRLLEYSRLQNKDMIKSICSEIDYDIIAVAKNCGIFDYLACKKLINRPSKKNIETDIPQLSKYLDECAAMIKEQPSPRI